MFLVGFTFLFLDIPQQATVIRISTASNGAPKEVTVFSNKKPMPVGFPSSSSSQVSVCTVNTSCTLYIFFNVFLMSVSTNKFILGYCRSIIISE